MSWWILVFLLDVVVDGRDFDEVPLNYVRTTKLMWGVIRYEFSGFLVRIVEYEARMDSYMRGSF